MIPARGLLKFLIHGSNKRKVDRVSNSQPVFSVVGSALQTKGELAGRYSLDDEGDLGGPRGATAALSQTRKVYLASQGGTARAKFRKRANSSRPLMA